MKEFLIIKSIFNNLKNFEVKELRKKLSGTSTRFESHKISLEYLNILANNSDLSLDDVQKKLYNKLNLIAFRKLNQRMFDKIIDVLSNKEVVEMNESYDARAKILFAQERKLLLVDIFRYRGLFKISDDLLNQIIISLKEYESYEILIYALYKKRIRFPGTDSGVEIKKIDEEIATYHKFSLTLSYVKKLYTDLLLLHNACEIKKILSEYRFAIRKIDSIKSKIDSITIRFYSSMINAEYQSMLGDDSKASSLLLKLLESVKGSTVFSNNRYGTVLLNIALYKRNNNEFNEAQMFLNEANKYLNRINETKIIVYYQNAVLYYIYGDLIKAQYHIKLMSNLDVNKIDVKLKNRIYFFYIINLFVAGKYQETLLHLISFKVNSKIDISLESEKKLLQFMTTIELSKYDQSDKIYDLLRKIKHDSSSSDFKLFTNNNALLLLGHLKYVGYDFSLLSKRDIELFNLISNDNIIKGDFLIPFTPWFKSKLKNVPYDHSAAMKEMRKKYKAEQIELA